MPKKAVGWGVREILKLPTEKRWVVIGGVVSILGLIIAALGLWIRAVPNPPQNVNGQPPIVNQAVNGSVIVTGNNNRIEPAQVFVHRAFLKADTDGQPPRVLTIRPTTKAVQAVGNVNPNNALPWLVSNGFFCPVGTEIEELPREPNENLPAALAVIDNLHTKIRVLGGENKGKEGWVLTKLIERKQERL